MAQPTAYNRVASFTNLQAASPTAPPPGNTMDAEYNAIKTTLDQLLQNLVLIQRDDGSLANKSVGKDQLAPEISIGFNAPQPWAQSTSYTSSPQSTVFYQAQFFRCTTSHLSTTTFDSTKWQLIADFSSIAIAAASNVAITPAGGVTKTNVQAAIYDLDTGKANTSHTHVSTDVTDSTAAGRSMLTAATVAAQLALLGITNTYLRPGCLQDTAEITLPAGYLWCDGTSYLRTDYAALFAAISITSAGNTTNGSAVISSIASTSDMRAGMPITGTNIPNATTILTVDSATQITLSANATGTTTAGALQVCPWGAADITHFNVPDLRGRNRSTRDDIGGVAANRLTTAGSSIAGTRLGATGGSQSITIARAALPNQTLSVTSTQQVIPAAATSTAASNTSANINVFQSSQVATLSATSESINGNMTQQTTNVMGPTAVCNTVIKT